MAILCQPRTQMDAPAFVSVFLFDDDTLSTTHAPFYLFCVRNGYRCVCYGLKTGHFEGQGVFWSVCEGFDSVGIGRVAFRAVLVVLTSLRKKLTTLVVGVHHITDRCTRAWGGVPRLRRSAKPMQYMPRGASYHHFLLDRRAQPTIKATARSIRYPTPRSKGFKFQIFSGFKDS